MEPDIHFIGTNAEVLQQFGRDFKIGWTETKSDTVLCTLNGMKHEVRIWNRPRVRIDLGLFLGMEVYREDS